MDADTHSVHVEEYLTEAEARALQSAAEVLRELEDRANRRSWSDDVEDVRLATRVHEAAHRTRDSVVAFLVAMEVYAETPAARLALDGYLGRDRVEAES